MEDVEALAITPLDTGRDPTGHRKRQRRTARPNPHRRSEQPGVPPREERHHTTHRAGHPTSDTAGFDPGDRVS
jgi:hypothetical protein